MFQYCLVLAPHCSFDQAESPPSYLAVTFPGLSVKYNHRHKFFPRHSSFNYWLGLAGTTTNSFLASLLSLSSREGQPGLLSSPRPNCNYFSLQINELKYRMIIMMMMARTIYQSIDNDDDELKQSQLPKYGWHFSMMLAQDMALNLFYFKPSDWSEVVRWHFVVTWLVWVGYNNQTNCGSWSEQNKAEYCPPPLSPHNPNTYSNTAVDHRSSVPNPVLTLWEDKRGGEFTIRI